MSRKWKDMKRNEQLLVVKRTTKFVKKGELGVAVGYRFREAGDKVEYYCNLKGRQVVLTEDDVELQYNGWSHILFNYSTWSSDKLPRLRKKIIAALNDKKKRGMPFAGIDTVRRVRKNKVA